MMVVRRRHPRSIRIVEKCGHVRLGSKADISHRNHNVRFTPESDIKCDICDVRYEPKADIGTLIRCIEAHERSPILICVKRILKCHAWLSVLAKRRSGGANVRFLLSNKILGGDYDGGDHADRYSVTSLRSNRIRTFSYR